MKSFTLAAIFIITNMIASGQNLIGYDSREIKKYMKENCKDMNINDVRNTRFKYLKYSDNYDNQTVLFFLSTDSVCKSVRQICDLSLKPQKVKEFNSIYNKVGENSWIETRNKKDYLVVIREEEWTFIVTIEPAK
ncbi:MAG: hypothetical protein MUO72_18170 [Bacteroidales bacterium]|nr:hypothetical protein [Bacteroidales bacterium]